MKDQQQTTACKYCGEQTSMLGTKLCNPCWELEKRIRTSPEMARKILAQFDLDHAAHMAKQYPPELADKKGETSI